MLRTWSMPVNCWNRSALVKGAWISVCPSGACPSGPLPSIFDELVRKPKVEVYRILFRYYPGPFLWGGLDGGKSRRCRLPGSRKQSLSEALGEVESFAKSTSILYVPCLSSVVVGNEVSVGNKVSRCLLLALRLGTPTRQTHGPHDFRGARAFTWVIFKLHYIFHTFKNHHLQLESHHHIHHCWRRIILLYRILIFCLDSVHWQAKSDHILSPEREFSPRSHLRP